MLAKFWFDVLTPKQVLFFKHIISELKKRGHEVLATSRRFREVEPIAKMNSLDLVYVGERGGSDSISQLLADIRRMEMLVPVVASFQPDIAVSVASNVCARISFGLRIKHVAVNDSPHSLIAGKLSLPLSYHLFSPWIIPYREWNIFGIKRNQITRYKALDPAAWLKRDATAGPIPDLDPDKKTVVIRLEESFAPYMIDKRKDWAFEILETVKENFLGMNIVVLCRYDEQYRNVKERYGKHMIIPSEPIDGRNLLRRTHLFIGMGGTMTAESALMGVPTISTFQGKLYTESYLISKGLLFKAKDSKSLTLIARRLLKEKERNMIEKRAKRILDSMEDPVSVIVSGLEKIIGAS
jgi:predicted glycosyltransferase